jgi:hypothetical protein
MAGYPFPYEMMVTKYEAEQYFKHTQIGSSVRRRYLEVKERHKEVTSKCGVEVDESRKCGVDYIDRVDTPTRSRSHSTQ